MARDALEDFGAYQGAMRLYDWAVDDMGIDIAGKIISTLTETTNTLRRDQ